MTIITFSLKGKEPHIPKDPRPQCELFYGVDCADWLVESGNTTLQSVTGEATGCTVIGSPFIQGTKVAIKVGTLDAAEGAVNSYTFFFECANTEKGVCTIYFDPEVQ